MSSVSFSFKLDQAKLKQIEGNVVAGVKKMGWAIANQAQRNAPVLSGALVDSIRVKDNNPTTVEVIAGGTYAGSDVPYALFRENENKAHPGKTHYMERAFNSVAKDWQKYFKGAI